MSGVDTPVTLAWGIYLSTTVAETGDVQGIVGHRETVADFRGKHDPVQFIAGKIGYLITGLADEMMVSPGIGIEPGLGLGIADLLGDSELYKGFQDPVDSGPRNARIPLGDGLMDLVRGRVIAAPG